MTRPTRTEQIAGLIELASWLEANPDVPLPWWTGVEVMVSVNNFDDLEPTDEARLAALHEIAGLVGEPVSTNRTHPQVRRGFSGDVQYRAYVIPKDEPAKDLPGEGEEVAGPGVEPATAPTDTAAGSDTCPADRAPVLSGAPAAVPAPVGIGDGAAVTPDVWVPIRRRGTNYHRPGEQRSTTCGRNMFPNGVRLLVDEALTFGAVPCPRCYGGSA